MFSFDYDFLDKMKNEFINYEISNQKFKSRLFSFYSNNSMNLAADYLHLILGFVSDISFITERTSVFCYFDKLFKYSIISNTIKISGELYFFSNSKNF